MNILNNK